MFCHPAGYTLAPEPEAGWLKFATHDLNHPGFGNARLSLDLIKRGAIFPRHPNNCTRLVWGEIWLGWFTHITNEARNGSRASSDPRQGNHQMTTAAIRPPEL